MKLPVGYPHLLQVVSSNGHQWWLFLKEKLPLKVSRDIAKLVANDSIENNMMLIDGIEEYLIDNKIQYKIEDVDEWAFM